MDPRFVMGRKPIRTSPPAVSRTPVVRAGWRCLPRSTTRGGDGVVGGPLLRTRELLQDLELRLDLDLGSEDDFEDREYVRGLFEAEYAEAMSYEGHD